jgi:hypothetical protein
MPGAASSSCSYAAVAIARSLFRKGAKFTAAMADAASSTRRWRPILALPVPSLPTTLFDIKSIEMPAGGHPLVTR